MKKWTYLLCAILVIVSLQVHEAEGVDENEDDITAIWGYVLEYDTNMTIEGAYLQIHDSLYTVMFETYTNETGYYYIELDFGAQYQVYVSCDGYDSLWLYQFVDSGQVLRKDFSLIPDYLNVDVTVYDYDTNHPIPGATVEFIPRDQGGIYYSGITDEEGVWAESIESGNYTLQVHHDDYYSNSIPLIEIRTGYSITIGMSPLPNGLRGMITDDSDEPIEGAVVTLTGEFDKKSDITDENGKYRILMEPGEYEVSVRSNGYQPYNGEVTITDTGMTELNVEMEKEKPMDMLLRILYLILEIISGVG